MCGMWISFDQWIQKYMVLLHLLHESHTRLADFGYIPERKSKNPRGLDEISLPLARMTFRLFAAKRRNAKSRHVERRNNATRKEKNANRRGRRNNATRKDQKKKKKTRMRNTAMRKDEVTAFVKTKRHRANDDFACFFFLFRL